jgi:outer membrane biosynthesis protein TonB
MRRRRNRRLQLQQMLRQPLRLRRRRKKRLHRPRKPTAAQAPAAKPKAAHAPAAAAQKPQAAAGLSQSKFLGILYSEIARRRPEKNSAGPGVVNASFRVNSSGRIDHVSIKNSTSPAHAEIVRKMLANVQAPPPPGGVFEGVQDFRFH